VLLAGVCTSECAASVQCPVPAASQEPARSRGTVCSPATPREPAACLSRDQFPVCVDRVFIFFFQFALAANSRPYFRTDHALWHWSFPLSSASTFPRQQQTLGRACLPASTLASITYNPRPVTCRRDQISGAEHAAGVSASARALCSLEFVLLLSGAGTGSYDSVPWDLGGSRRERDAANASCHSAIVELGGMSWPPRPVDHDHVSVLGLGHSSCSCISDCYHAELSLYSSSDVLLHRYHYHCQPQPQPHTQPLPPRLLPLFYHHMFITSLCASRQAGWGKLQQC
jgi:hypothetical protein